MPDPVAPPVVPVVPVTPPVDPALALVTPPATVVPPVTPPVAPPASITAPVTPPVTPPATPPAVPEKYDLKLPEKSVLEASAVDEIAAYAKAQGLSQVQAAALVEHQSKFVESVLTKRQEQQEAAVEAEIKKWEGIIETDKEFGGENFKKSSELTKRFAKRFGDEEFFKLMNETGLGSHPAIFRFVARAAAVTSEDTLERGITGGGSQIRPGSDAALQAALFTSMKKE